MTTYSFRTQNTYFLKTYWVPSFLDHTVWEGAMLVRKKE